MAGLTREQRAAREAAKPAEEKPKADGPNVLMEKDGKQAEVANNASVAIMEALGWRVV